jgi:hypothetical protein
MHKEVLPKFSASCIDVLNDEAFFGTTNHYFNSKFREEEICPQALIDAFAVYASRVLVDDSKSAPYRSDPSYRRVIHVDHLRKCLEEAKAEVAAKDLHATLIETQKKRLFSAVQANFDVEKKTLADNLLKKTKGILLRGHKEWIGTHLIRSEKIHSAAGEDDSIAEYRKTLIAQKGRLEACMLLLREVPLPSSSDASEDSPSESTYESD